VLTYRDVETGGAAVPSIERRVRGGELRWYARFRDPAGAKKVKVFNRRVDAERFLTTVEASKLTGSYIDPKRAAITFGAFAQEHRAAYSHTLAADPTRVRKRSVLDRHILPALGNRPIGTIKPSTVAAALGTWSRTLAPGMVGQILRQVRQIPDAALADGLVANKSVTAAAAPRRRDLHLTDDHVAALIAAAPELHRALVITLVGAGLRIGEACGLQVDDIDFSGAPLRIRQQRRPGGELGPLKTGSSRREISADDAVLGALAEQFRRWPGRDGLVFSSSSGRPLTKAIAGYEFDAIERTVGFTVSPHSLRRYFGASLVSRGVSVVAVSRWLGHSSPEITYRVYAYRKPDDEQAARDATAKTMRQLVPHVYPMCTEKGAE
jgi:integrase